MSVHRQSALIIGLCLVVSSAQAQSITTNYGADPAMNAPPETRQASVLDYVIPYIPVVGPRWQEKREEKRAMESAPPPQDFAPPPPRKKKAAPAKTRTAKARPVKKIQVLQAKPKLAAPQPAAETLTPPPPTASVADVSALTQCLSRFTVREVARGSNASADHLMAQAADRDCGVEFRGMADAITRSADKEQARETLQVLIRDTLSPAVERAMAQAKSNPAQ